MTFLSKFILFSTFSFSFFAINFSLISNYFRKSTGILFQNNPAVVVEWLCFIVQSMAHVWIPLGDIYMVKILNKKELWTRYILPWNCNLNGQRQQPGKIKFRHNNSRIARWRENPYKDKNTQKTNIIHNI